MLMFFLLGGSGGCFHLALPFKQEKANPGPFSEGKRYGIFYISYLLLHVFSLARIGEDRDLDWDLKPFMSRQHTLATSACS